MRISRPLAGTAIAAGVLGASLGLGLTMASASTSASPAATHSTAARSSQGAGVAGARSHATAHSGPLAKHPGSQAKKAAGHPCPNMPGRGTSGSGSNSSGSATGS